MKYAVWNNNKMLIDTRNRQSSVEDVNPEDGSIAVAMNLRRSNLHVTEVNPTVKQETV